MVIKRKPAHQYWTVLGCKKEMDTDIVTDLTVRNLIFLG